MPERAWLTSSSVEMPARVARRSGGIGTGAGGRHVGLLHFWAVKPDSHKSCRHSNPERRLNPACASWSLRPEGRLTLRNILFCSNGHVTPRVCGFTDRRTAGSLYRIALQMRAFPHVGARSARGAPLAIRREGMALPPLGPNADAGGDDGDRPCDRRAAPATPFSPSRTSAPSTRTSAASSLTRWSLRHRPRARRAHYRVRCRRLCRVRARPAASGCPAD